MLFSSYEFLFAFLPLTALGYFALSRVNSPYPQRVFLVAASLFFYSFFEWRYFLIIAASILVNFAAAKISLGTDSKQIKQLLLFLSVVFNVGLIGYYKYYDFAVDTLNSIASTDFMLKGILIPLGISFFTFQQLSFQIRTYKTADKSLNFIDYTLFVSFFPQLIAGPIVLYEELVPQIKDETKRFFNLENFATGFSVFTVGMAKKLIIADGLSVIVDNGFASQSELGLLPAWVCAFAYAFQIYFDFSGYSEMAIGLGRMFNYDLPVNFESPYQSASIGEFWKRWHITLGRSLHEFVYVPLGGNRKGKARKCINLFFTFLVSGIWHGANWTFIIWGVAHGVARVAEEIFAKPIQKLPLIVRKTATFLFATLAFVIFRAENISQAAHVYNGLVNFADLGISQFKGLMADGVIGMPNIASIAFAAAITAFCFVITFKEKGTSHLITSTKLTSSRAAATAVMLVASVLCMSRSAVFIYFNF